MLTAAGVAVVVSGIAVSSAWAAPTGRAASTGRADTALFPRAGQWWFTSWKILPKVWPLSQGAGVTVAVLDSGVQASVPDLRGAVVPGGDVTGHHTNGETDFNTDGDGHGTMMSVLIAGQGNGTDGTGMAGVAPKAKILPVVVNAGTTDVTADPGAIAAGIIYAANHGAKVIDISQEHPAASASGCDAAEQAAVAYALARDIVVIAAAGDTNLIGAAPSEPASCAGVLAVGSVQPNRALWPGDTRQPYITVVNPGADLITSGRDGRLLADVSGTRAASALAAGAVALIRSRYPALRWYQVAQRLTGTAVRAGGAVPNDSFGYGIFRLSHAVNATAFPVAADAPDPVYAKFREWQATPQGRSVSRQLTKPQAQPPTAPRTAPRATGAAKGGSATPVLVAIIALLAALGAGVLAYRARATRTATTRTATAGAATAGGAAARGRHVSRGPGWNHLRRDESEATFPDLLAREDTSVLLAEPDEFPYDDRAGEYLPLGDTTPYRIPPYSPPPDDSLLAPDRDDPRALTGFGRVASPAHCDILVGWG
ncbi:MAG TPA: S8 family serine peptidase [Streptosporangiaceae bacterium]